jgi:hypothetical protein
VACVTDSEYPTLAARGFLRRAAELFQQKYPDESVYQKVTADTTTFTVPGMEALLTGMLCSFIFFFFIILLYITLLFFFHIYFRDSCMI